MSNPWSLSRQQCAALDAVAIHGSAKLAGKALGLSHKTVEDHIMKAKRQMRLKHRILAVLAWDRHTRDKAIVTALILNK